MCLNTFLVVLLHSRLTVPILLPHTSLCSTCLMLGRIKCIKLLVSKSSIEKMVFIFCQPPPKKKPEAILEKKFSQKMRPAFERETMTQVKWGQAHPAAETGPEFGFKVCNDAYK